MILFTRMKKYCIAAVMGSCIFSWIGLSFTHGNNETAFIQENLRFAKDQLTVLLEKASRVDSLFPRTLEKDSTVKFIDKYDWTSGFFAGCLWYGYEGNAGSNLKKEAIAWTEKLEPLQYYTEHHDLGFMMYCSYGNAYRLTGNEHYKQILVQAAKSLSSRFSPASGSIRSWNGFRSWHGGKLYNFPVIIDNMMNLELLFFASRVTGDPHYRNMAVRHAENVMKHQVRNDYSCYHVICYDSATGAVQAKFTAQGYADNSTWARGQSWGIYGFTMAYRETGDKRFLQTAARMADFYIDHKNLPSDMVCYWDFNANEKGYTPGIRSRASETPVDYRDAAAAAVTASALLELSTFTVKNNSKYRDAAVKILHSLAGKAYRAKPGANGGFILQHCVGSIPHGVEIDVPLVYADYYFLEALIRYQRILKNQPVTVIEN